MTEAEFIRCAARMANHDGRTDSAVFGKHGTDARIKKTAAFLRECAVCAALKRRQAAGNSLRARAKGFQFA